MSTTANADERSNGGEGKRQAIWLRVSEVRLQSDRTDSRCRVRLTGDCGDPKPVWWPVAQDALSGAGKEGGLEVYKAILNELGKNRLVIARLGWAQNRLECEALRFQSPELAGH